MDTFTNLELIFGPEVIEVKFQSKGTDSTMGEYTSGGLLAEIYKVEGGFVAMSFAKPFRVFPDVEAIKEWAESKGCPVTISAKTGSKSRKEPKGNQS